MVGRTIAIEPTDYPAAVSKGVAYYGTFYPNDNNQGVCAVELATGASLWCYNTGDVGSPVAVSGNTAYVNTFNGTVFALNAKTGALAMDGHRPGLRQQLQPPGGCEGNVVYVGGHLLWPANMPSRRRPAQCCGRALGNNNYASGPSVANGVVYAECNGRCALDAFDAELCSGTLTTEEARLLSRRS